MPKRSHAAATAAPLLLHPAHKRTRAQNSTLKPANIVPIIAAPVPTAANAAFVAARQLMSYSIVEVTNILNDLPPGSLIVFDFDNTLYEPLQLIGSDQWFELRIGHNVKKHQDPKVGIDVTVDEYNHVQRHTKVQAVEPETVQCLLKLLQKHNVIGLTTRGKDLIEATFKQIKSLGVEFKISRADAGHEVHLAQILADSPTSHAINSVIFAGGRSKGACLKAYLQHMKIDSSNCPHIAFIDDKSKHVNVVSATAQELGIPSTCVHYRNLDYKLDAVDLRVAEVQYATLRYLGGLIPDTLALRIVEHLEANGVVLETAASHQAHLAAVTVKTAAAQPRPNM